MAGGGWWAMACAVLALLGCGCADAGAGRSAGGKAAGNLLPAGRKLDVAEQMMWSTYAVGTKKSMATAFVVLRKEPGARGGVVPVVVTTGHALRVAPKGPWYLGLRYRDADGKLQIAIAELSPREPPVKHPRHDVVAFAVRMPESVAKLVELPSFLTEASLETPAAQARVGREICMLGFPDVLPGTAGAFPVLRGGRVASYGVAMVEDPHRFVVNAQVYPGDSGGPVFVTGRRGRPELVGMVTMRVADHGKGVVPLAVAVDASVIRETLAMVKPPPGTSAPKRP